jgi:hypothetical protein
MTAIYTDRMGLDWYAGDPDEMAVADVLDLTLNTVTSYGLALGYMVLPQDDVEGWDALAEEQLLDRLTKEQLAKAVLRLIAPHAAAHADQTWREIRGARTPSEFALTDLPRRDTT